MSIIIGMVIVFALGWLYSAYEDELHALIKGATYKWDCPHCKNVGNKFKISASTAEIENAVKSTHLRTSHPEKENIA